MVDFNFFDASVPRLRRAQFDAIQSGTRSRNRLLELSEQQNRRQNQVRDIMLLGRVADQVLASDDPVNTFNSVLPRLQGVITTPEVLQGLSPASSREEIISEARQIKQLASAFGGRGPRILSEEETTSQGFDPGSVVQQSQSGFQVLQKGRNPEDSVLEKQKRDEEKRIQTLKTEEGLRKEFTKLGGDFKKVSEAFARVQASAEDPSAAGDLALIFNFMKILDPGSVVRESEFANAQNTGSIPQRIWAQYNRVLRGERLSVAQRQDFVNRAQRLFLQQKSVNDSRAADFERLAIDAGVNPENVIIDFGGPQEIQPSQDQVTRFVFDPDTRRLVRQ